VRRAAALRTALVAAASLKREGYRFVTVTDMLGYRLVYR
jgi:hypothetical protein